MLFPKAKLPMQDMLVPLDDGMGGSMFATEWRIADFISLRASGQLAGGRAGAAARRRAPIAGDDPAVARGLEGDPRRDRQ